MMTLAPTRAQAIGIAVAAMSAAGLFSAGYRTGYQAVPVVLQAPAQDCPPVPLARPLPSGSDVPMTGGRRWSAP